MDKTPNVKRPYESASYPYYPQEALPEFVPHTNWMNTPNRSQSFYGGGYFPCVAQPPNISTSSSSTPPSSSSNARSSSSNGLSNADDSDTAVAINPSSQEIGAKLTRWREEQTTVLVHEWRERIEDLERSRATETWRLIAEAVNKAGTQKTTKQCKNKIRNLKQSYKEAKANNNQTGSSPKTSPFFDTFDDVLRTRAVVSIPGVIQSDSLAY
ncbi:uncharacterized protein LOC114527411 [Dendronephthya gigantea]|uniref:uncharacterized protein LOC114527411 n=1 Tax=Dendronephthya gigantea TaxID=151771 RepID=UPI00106B3736|nr:uncharacterized protein LOC114527411 [Dendronephthya gigantea]